MQTTFRKWQQTINDLLILDSFGVPRPQVQAAINRSLMRYLPFMYTMVALFFVGYALLQMALLKETGANLMVAAALASAAVMFLGGWVLRRGMFAPHLSEILTAFGAALVLFSIVLRAQLTADPKQAANLALFLFAMAIIFVSPVWYGLFSLLTLSLLTLAIFTFPPTTDWPYFVVVTIAAMATGFLAHVVRVRAYRHTVILRIVEEKQRRELQRRTVQLQTAVGVGQHITSILDLDALLNQIADLVQQKYQVHYVGVFLPDESHMRLTAVTEAGPGVEPDQPLQAGMAGLMGWVMQHGQALRVENVLQDNRFVPVEATPRTQSELILPLKMGEDLFGVLDLQSERSCAFAEDELSAYQLLADQVAIALENARLYDEVKQFNQELEDKVSDRTHALQAAYGRLEKLDKTKADFITIASHELRTPLTIVNFNSQMFLEDEDILANNLYRGWAEGIHRGVMRMEGVVENILDVAKIDSRSLELYPSPMNIRYLALQVVSQLKRELGNRELLITVSDMPDLPEIEADVEAMEKLFFQLLINAIKYTPDGGNIRIDGRLQQQPANGRAPYEEVEITVTDTGIGIMLEVQELIFEKFYQTGAVQHHSSGLTSLGAVVQALVWRLQKGS